jgi:DNA-binding LytR/AlgR family response regulator
MPRALIVEDEAPLAAELAELLCELWPGLELAPIANNGLQALQTIFADPPDIAFLDIQIPAPNGLEVARIIRDQCHIVFVTAYDAHAIEAFEKGALDYLLKPISRERLAITVQRLQQRAGSRAPDLTARLPVSPSANPSANPASNQATNQATIDPANKAPRYLRWLSATVGSSLRLVMIDEVVFFQAEQKYTRVVLADSEVLIKKSLKELLSELDPEQFWQTHRSTLVNALEIASIEPNLAGKLAIRLKRRREQLPVSEAFVRQFRQM